MYHLVLAVFVHLDTAIKVVLCIHIEVCGLESAGLHKEFVSLCSAGVRSRQDPIQGGLAETPTWLAWRCSWQPHRQCHPHHRRILSS